MNANIERDTIRNYVFTIHDNIQHNVTDTFVRILALSLRFHIFCSTLNVVDNRHVWEEVHLKHMAVNVRYLIKYNTKSCRSSLKL